MAPVAKMVAAWPEDGLPPTCLAADTDIWRHADDAFKMLREQYTDPALADWTDDEKQALVTGLLAGRFYTAMIIGHEATDEELAAISPASENAEV